MIHRPGTIEFENNHRFFPEVKPLILQGVLTDTGDMGILSTTWGYKKVQSTT